MSARRPLSATRTPVLLVVASTLTLAACTSVGGHASPSSTTTATPAALVPGPPARYRQVTVSAGRRTAAVGEALLPSLAPLLIARDFGVRPDLVDYGLDRPQATLTFIATSSAATVVLVGAANFDRNGFYAMRRGDNHVYLVLADAIRPVIALVGIDVVPPSS